MPLRDDHKMTTVPPGLLKKPLILRCNGLTRGNLLLLQKSCSDRRRKDDVYRLAAPGGSLKNTVSLLSIIIAFELGEHSTP